MSLVLRVAVDADIPAIAAVMDRAITELQAAFLDPAQIAASRSQMGLDRQLIADASYFVAEIDGQIVGCGGWSARATRYGGDHSAGRDTRRLDPATEAARVRAMYTDPGFVRRGVGRAILATCEAAAGEAGFAHAKLVATAAGEPFYTAAGYTLVARFDDTNGAVPVPLATMRKRL